MEGTGVRIHRGWRPESPTRWNSVFDETLQRQFFEVDSMRRRPKNLVDGAEYVSHLAIVGDVLPIVKSSEGIRIMYR